MLCVVSWVDAICEYESDCNDLESKMSLSKRRHLFFEKWIGEDNEGEAVSHSYDGDDDDEECSSSLLQYSWRET